MESLIASFDRNKLERCDKIDLLKVIGYTSLFTWKDSAKVIGFYGHLAIKEMKIYLNDIATAFFLETDEKRKEWRTHSLSLMRKAGWQLQRDSEEEMAATKGKYHMRVRQFACSKCGRQVFGCLLYYPSTDTPPDLPVKHPWCRKGA